jgi:hypothetical protein
MFERPSAVLVLATEKGTADTARNAVIVGGVIETYEGFSWLRHCSFLDTLRFPLVLYFGRDVLLVNGWVSAIAALLSMVGCLLSLSAIAAIVPLGVPERLAPKDGCPERLPSRKAHRKAHVANSSASSPA